MTADTQRLRIELKEWEHGFLEIHGRKPARADIKSDRDIAAKYKLYDKLTRKPSSTRNASTTRPALSSSSLSSSPTDSKRKRDSGIGLLDEVDAAAVQTPKKASRKPLSSSSTLEETSSDPFDPPLNEFFSPAAQRTFVGPTPQKNGQVLGLFDLLSPEASRQNSTPRKKDGIEGLASLQASRTPSRHATTPSRSRMGPPVGTPSRNHVVSAPGILTPSRSGLNVQLRQEQGDGKIITTPSVQRAKLLDLDDTPECLKRRRSPMFRPATSTGVGTTTELERLAGGTSSMVNSNENENSNDNTDDGTDGLMSISWSPIAVRQPRRPMGRSFSQIIGDNRRAEEERYDDDLAILHELEEEAAGTGSTAAANKSDRRRSVGGTRTMQVQRSQSAMEPLGTDITPNLLAETSRDLPLGPDGEREVDRSDDDNVNNDGKGQDGAKPGARRWKKKGPKRQTRRFNIKPTQARWQPEPEWKAGMESDGDSNDIVPETQVPGRNSVPENAGELESDYEDHSGSDGEAQGKTKSRSKGQKTSKPAKSQQSKKPKKVSATAHANYRTLRIKNKSSKAKRGGRFGRRKGF